MATVTETIKCSPPSSASRHPASLGISNTSVRQLRYKVLHFHPYKNPTGQTFKDNYHVNHISGFWKVIKSFTTSLWATWLTLWVTWPTFHLS